MEIKLSNKEARILWNAINVAQSNGMIGLERLKSVSNEFIDWKVETLEELIILQKIKIDIDNKFEK